MHLPRLRHLPCWRSTSCNACIDNRDFSEIRPQDVEVIRFVAEFAHEHGIKNQERAP